MNKSGKTFVTRTLVLLVVTFLLTMLLLSACSTKNPEIRDDPSRPGVYRYKRTNFGGYHFYRIIDTEAGVVCYSTGWSGIDCLPIDQTRLSKE